jgi:hypothetical protein
VRVIEHTLIPLKDGTMLAARIWLPDDAEQNPVPAILEYLPYRKRDGTYERDALTHPYLAGHGYAGVRVDLRGSGESTGLLFDEYARQEQVGGTFLTTAGLEWAFFFFSLMCLPPDPALVGDSWRAMWLERLRNIPLFQEKWLRGGVNLYCADFPRVRGPERRATRWRRLGGGWPPSPILFSGILFSGIRVGGERWSSGDRGERCCCGRRPRSSATGSIRYHPDRNRTELGRRQPLLRGFPARARTRAPRDPLAPPGRRLAAVANSF